MDSAAVLIMLAGIKAGQFGGIDAFFIARHGVINCQEADIARILTDERQDRRQVDLGDEFIAVQSQNPIIGGMSGGEVPGGAEIIDPCKINHLGGILGGNFLGAVGGTGIGNDDFEAIGADFLQALRDIFGFIFSDDTDGDGGHGLVLS